MAILININTATENAAVSISKNGKLIGTQISNDSRKHAAFLHPAIESLLKTSGYEISSLDAIAVLEGPGSYTGLRVGMASAKGLSYALKKPLITIGTLPAMAMAMIDHQPSDELFYCPMMDARRMEVFTAVYNKHLEALLAPCAMILEPTSFHEYFKKNKILFAGNGTVKWEKIVNDPHAFFEKASDHHHAFIKIAYNKFLNRDFSDVVYSEPLYLKDFYLP
ncbi:MAG TPA: tRNA (adenosine(37)-N6)-threonylcarbamoyltransferase complex dimerization subunit type 1 TsaB [Ferruginibacter sp.]|nr:tRNA (adenosine(37)-N6)-threonylcarbamoyltransferase complex dimerization subunit type 1 TsaB [Ferruginibacter sp.]